MLADWFKCFDVVAQLILALSAVVALVYTMLEIKQSKEQKKTENTIKYCARFTINKDIRRVTKFIEKSSMQMNNIHAPKPDEHQALTFMEYFAEIQMLIEADAIDGVAIYKMLKDNVLGFDKRISQWPNLEHYNDIWSLYNKFVNWAKTLDTDSIDKPKFK